ncbi:MAG: hypothetical protein AB7V62_05365 [Thermoleophilia bacterium]
MAPRAPGNPGPTRRAGRGAPEAGEVPMYIGAGALVVILIIVLLVILL